jgi:hypothetical protein
MRNSTLSTLLIAAFMALLLMPANAQATRTWVSRDGDDANPCSISAPCKTFGGAIPKTAAFGEINVIYGAGFGGLTITKSITIRADHVEAGVIVGGTDAITIKVGSSDKVVLEGLDIEGEQAGLNGITITGSGTIDIVRCAIRNFTQNAVNVVGTAGARAFLYDSVIVNNGGGLNMQGAAGAANAAVIENTLIDNNTNFATQTVGASTLTLIGSTLTGSPAGIIASNGAKVLSYGNNVLEGSGAPTQTSPRQ